MLKVKSARTVGFVAAAALLLAGLALALWPAGAVQAQDEEPPPVANLKCEARTDRVRFSWDIPQWSGGETKWYDVAVTLPNGNRFTERRHRDLRSRTYRGKWQPASEARIVVKALYDLPNGDRVTSAASEAQCVVPGTPNSAPTVSSAIADATIINESGTHQVTLTGVFSDADNDALTITATSSAETVATVSVASDQSALTVAAKNRGTATITVTAADGNGGTVEDTFTVTVKAAPEVAAAIADVSGLEVDATRQISMSGVFSDADGDALTITAASSDGGKATVSVAADYANLTVAGVAEGSATVTVTARDADGNTVDDAFDVAVDAAAKQQPANNPPTVSSAIADATIINESGTHQVALTGVFTDADGDSLTITASSSDDTIATATVSADQSALTVGAKSRGTGTITVTAADGNGGTVDDVFTVTVKSAPVVTAAIADVSELKVDVTHQVSMSGVFSDADGDAVTVTQASSSDGAKVAVVSALEGLTAAITAVTVTGKSEGTATITVTAQDADGNTVSDAFDVTVPAAAVQLQQTQSSDATLSALTLSGYTLNGDPTPAFGLRPAFASGATEYAASAPQFTARVSVTATTTDPGAAIQVDGQTVASGAPSQLIRLVDNQPKKITVTVTAADGTTQQSYTVAATGDPRADLRDLTLSPGELHPSIFTTAEQDYRAWTPHSVNSVRVTATRRHGVETLTVNGQAVTSGQASPDIALEVGENLITVVATAPDGYTSRSYTITVTRLTEALSSDATLSGIKVYQATSFQPDNANNVPYEGDPLTIAPAISRTEREYRAEQPEADGIYVAVAVTTNAPGARSIVINGPKVNLERRDPKDEVVSGEASGPWQMSLGYQLITIKVTSLDGKNTETYRLVIKRGTVDDLKGLRLSSGDGALTLSWEASDSPTAPTDYMLRWRKAGEMTWLNSGFPPGWKTSFALDAAYAGPAEGDRFAALSQGSATLSGLENGVAYEVQARGARGPLNPATGERQVFVFLRTDWQSLTGTPGAAQTTLSITPSNPTRVYGGANDLGYTVSGLKSGDAATDVLTGSLSRASGEDAGDYAINLGTLAVASAHAGKYNLPAAPAVTTYTITPRPITAISGVTVASRAADGTTDASFDTSVAAGTGVLPAELADFRAGGLAVSGAFPLAVPGTHDVSVTYSLQDHGAFKAANYSLSATGDTLRGELTAVAACAAGMMLFADGAPAEGGAPVTVTVGLSNPAGVGGASATLTASGTATGDDYTLSPTTVAIAEGATAGTVTITVIDDAVDDDDETIVLNAALSGSNLTAGPLTLTIADNDDAATPAPTPVAAAGCPVPAGGDYDADDDGLIEICNLAQLVAIDYDLDGDGTPSTSHTSYNAYNIPTRPVYAAAFPGAASGMGCPQTGCIGYELTTDLDFDRNGNGRADANDGYKAAGWIGIGQRGKSREVGFATIFEGNGHVIKNLYLYDASHNGLFHRTLSAAVIRNVGLEDVLLNGSQQYVAGLVGENRGTIINSYTTGQVSGKNGVGGLVGGSSNTSMIIGSYSTATVTGSSDDVGGLVGGNEGTIIASYATGNVTGTGEADDNYVAGGSSGSGHAIGGLVGLNYPDQKIIASYATGTVTAPKGRKVGGLAGFNLGRITASYSTGTVSGTGQLSGLTYSDNSWENDPYARHSYWDTVTSGQATSVQGVGKTTAELQSPTGYAGIYANWNVDLDGDGSADDPWDFGTSCQYPVLKYGGLNPDDQRAPWPCAAGATPQSQRMFVTAHIDDHAAGFDEMAVLSIDLPQGVTMTPAFRSDHYSYELTVPDDTDGLTFAAIFDPESELVRGCCISKHVAFAVLLVGDMAPADAEARWFGPDTKRPLAYPTIEQMIVANSGGIDARSQSMHGQTNRVELPPDATTGIYISLYKTPLGNPHAFVQQASKEKALKRKVVYTLTVTRGDPSAGDSSGGAAQSAPTVASPIADLTGLEVGATRDVSLSGVFSDADGDSLTVTAASSDEAKATVTVAADYSKLTVTGVAVGTATITVTAQDADGNRVSDTFDAPVARKYNALIAQMYEWRNDPTRASKAHTDRWDRALLAFGETVADTSLTAMTASEAQTYADRGWERWAPVAKALAEIEAGGSG